MFWFKPKFQENVSLARFSHYAIGGPARFFFEPRSEREVARAVREAKARALPVFVLGGGTNLLLSDTGFEGLVLRPTMTGISMATQDDGGTVLEVGAGAPMAAVLEYATVHSLSGLEWAGGLPGTLGGAIRGNAGCFGGEIKDAVASVRSFDMATGTVVERSASECAFGYRDSIFKKNGQEIIFSARLAVAKGDQAAIASATREKIAYRLKNHPMEHPNIGSIFKNVPLATIHAASTARYRTALAKQSLTFRKSQFSVKTDPFPVVSSAKLIGESGLRGVSFGGAMISSKHPNFIVNTLGATAVDVRALISLAKAEVARKFGVMLEEEVQVV